MSALSFQKPASPSNAEGPSIVEILGFPRQMGPKDFGQVASVGRVWYGGLTPGPTVYVPVGSIFVERAGEEKSYGLALRVLACNDDAGRSTLKEE
eukprot:5201142-Alexandrium_andersonii.AAC.1